MNDLEEPKQDVCWFCGKPNTDYEDIDLMARVHETCKEDAIFKQNVMRVNIKYRREEGEILGRKPLSPAQGGCWYCKLDHCDVYDREFDTMLHLECLETVLDIDPNHPEAKCQSYLLDDHDQPPNKGNHIQD